MKTFKVGDKVKILSYNNFETMIESIEGDLYWSKDEKGELSVCTAEEMELVSEYNETFNPEAHSSLIIDFDKVETIEEAIDRLLVERGEHIKRVNNPLYSEERKLAIDLTKSDAARNYWYQKFIEEKQLFTLEDMYMLSAKTTYDIAKNQMNSEWNLKTTPKTIADEFIANNKQIIK